jgi:membrane-associated phospholipid phosphatase
VRPPLGGERGRRDPGSDVVDSPGGAGGRGSPAAGPEAAGRPPGPGVVPTLLALGAGLIVLALSALPIDADHVGGLEEEVFRFLNDDLSLPEGPVWLVMQLGSVVVVPLVVAAALFARRRQLAVTAAVAGTFVYAMGKVVRHLVPRGRPASILGDVTVRDPAVGSGYLSGHMALAVAMAAAVTPYLGWRGRVAVWTLAALVGLGRIHVGVHMPLDVVGGAGLGLAGWAAVHLAVAALPAAVAARRSPPQPVGS